MNMIYIEKSFANFSNKKITINRKKIKIKLYRKYIENKSFKIYI